MEQQRRVEGADVTVMMTEVPVAAKEVRSVLKTAGAEGIKVRAFFNHESLSKYSHSEINEALRAEMNALHVVLGEAATKYYWILDS